MHKFFLIEKNDLEKIGYYLFLTGIFFLCSSLFLAALFLLPSLVIGGILQTKEKNFFEDKWNLSFLLCGILIIINALLQRFFLTNNFKEIWNADLTLLGMANWIPFFWLFWTFQYYLNSSLKRKRFILLLISGTFPLLVSGFGQYFFNWTGPLETLNSLIIWYQRPIENPGGLSGLFSNQNYAGSWLNLVWPFCIALIFQKSQNLIKKSFSILFFSSIGLAIFLTYSRNAWTGLLVSLPIVIGSESLFWTIPFFISGIIFFIYYFANIFSVEILETIKNYLPEKFIMEFAEEGYEGLDATRLEILSSALRISLIRPLIGIGAASFSAIYALETNFYKGHSHNLLTELAISYGIPVTIIFFSSVTLLLIKSGLIIFLRNSKLDDNDFIDRAYWSSIFFFFISQLADIQYFDGKISIIVWCLLAGVKNIIEEYNQNLLKE
tara:strand:- start:48184 stop:49497 length:1314 start_codon:yes stop_codon:yes gene_type:complete